MAQSTKIEYKHPEVLVETQWLDKHLSDPNVRIIEVDYDSKANYLLGHIRGAVLADWKKDINHSLSRDILTKENYENLLQRFGLDDDSKTLVLYGDFNNWFAAFAFWVFKYYGYKDVRLLNGGRKKWLEEDKEITKEIPNYPKGMFNLGESFAPDSSIRIFLSDIKDSLVSRRRFQIRLVDVRSPDEYHGRITAPPEYPTEHAQRAGHIPGASNIPWAQVLNDDGTFKTFEELSKLYEAKGIHPDNEVITYCRIGERSSHTWFVLKYLLGYPDVKNYDGSWTEWGNLIGNPIEKDSI
ncbi:Putative thiosulfate sulfurtransferase [Candidatus Nitrosocosmicus oleophilus]|uniref:Sulfurtransferase n=1 Tax=Candidatus Nitrosocosmicus oleophilus TaxID=1353260 RepID=A0A654M1S2_9ARCH|nr:sulfurtransferase [Candidatus Nitrosocosmicus oleophilus]ALI36616.1 Putative thiosulfate sulfurtransferase [Candidatus Nitrosocosmicus oleophilus]